MNLFSRSVLFCLFGYLMYFKPAQPFLVDFLEDTKNFTPTQVYSDIFPIWTYAQLLFMIIFGVLAEFTKIGYLPIVIFGAICLFSEPFFMLFGTSLATMQFCEVAVGAGVSSIQVFSAYTYSAVPKVFYQKITGYVRMSFLIGTVSGSLLGQILILVGCSVTQLYYITAVTSLLAVIVTLCLPHGRALQRTLEKENEERDAFNIQNSDKNESEEQEITTSDGDSSENELKDSAAAQLHESDQEESDQQQPEWKTLLYGIFLKYRPIFRFCCWLVISLPVHSLALTYIQSLVSSLPNYSPEHNFNGFLFSSSYILAAFTPLIPSYFESFFSKTLNVEATLQLVAVTCAALLVFMAVTSSLLPLYCTFITYHCLFEFQITLIFGSIAKRTPEMQIDVEQEDSEEDDIEELLEGEQFKLPKDKGRRPFAMTFSLCVFVSLVMQCLIQFVMGKDGIGLGIHYQFIFLGFFLLIMTFLLFVSFVSGCR